MTLAVLLLVAFGVIIVCWRLPWRLAVLLVGGGLLAGGSYSLLGNPSLPDAPFDRQQQSALERRALQQHAADLSEALQRQPGNIDLWLAAGRAYAALGDFARAEAAFRGGMVLAPERPELLTGLGEVLTRTAQGQVPPEARQLFEALLVKQPDNAAALYYLGLAARQVGDTETALMHWKKLERLASKEAAWYPAFMAEYSKLLPLR